MEKNKKSPAGPWSSTKWEEEEYSGLPSGLRTPNSLNSRLPLIHLGYSLSGIASLFQPAKLFSYCVRDIVWFFLIDFECNLGILFPPNGAIHQILIKTVWETTPSGSQSPHLPLRGLLCALPLCWLALCACLYQITCKAMWLLEHE